MDIKLAYNEELLEISRETEVIKLCDGLGYDLFPDWQGYLTSPATYLLQGIYQERTYLRAQLSAMQPSAPSTDVLVEALRKIADETHNELWQKEYAEKTLAAYKAKLLKKEGWT